MEEPEVAWALEREVLELPVLLRMRVDGDPRSKSRPRVTKTGRAYTPKETVEAEVRIGLMARQAGWRGPADDFSSFGLLVILFTANWQRRDVDNMIKLVADGLTGVVWKDDSQVTEMAGRVKRADPFPRTHILVYQTMLQRPDMRGCVRCGAFYRVYESWGNRRYCSNKCAAEAQQHRVTLFCLGCMASVEYTEHRAARVGKVFCSRACQQRVQAPERVCDRCGVIFRKPRSQRQGQFVYCGRECSAAAKRGAPRGSA